MYLISDLHFWHKNILKYEPRPFDTVEEMNDSLLININATVNKKDTLLILGDFAFCGAQKIQKLREMIKCQNVELLMGNHDRGRSLTWWEEKGFSRVYQYPIVMGGKYILSHEPLSEVPKPFYNIHGHTHGKNMEGRYYNVSVENINYKPILFDTIKETFKGKEYG